MRKKFLRFNEEKRLEPVEEEVKEKKDDSSSGFVSYIALALELGFTVSFPIAGGALLGQYLDNKFGTTPKLTLSLIFSGMILAGINIYNIIKASR